MTATETKLKGCFIIEPELFKDGRGYFFESFNQHVFNKWAGEDVNFVQDNQSSSSRGVLRGLHYQQGTFAQAKLVRVIKGKILDIAVDLRKGEATFGQYVALELSEENKKQLYIPRGFAHGFLVLEDRTVFAYKCDNYYHKASEVGILFSDPTLNIDWNFPLDKIILSEKDKALPTFKSLFK